MHTSRFRKDTTHTHTLTHTRAVLVQKTIHTITINVLYYYKMMRSDTQMKNLNETVLNEINMIN